MKVRHQLLLALSFTGLVVAVVVAIGSLAVLRTAAREQTRARLRAETGLLAQWVSESSDRHSDQDLARLGARRLGVRVTLIDAEGTVLGDSARPDDQLASMDNHLQRPEVQAARLHGTGDSVRRSSTTDRLYLYSARRLASGSPVEYVRLALPVSDAARVAPRYLGALIGVLVGALALLVLIGYAAVRRISRPVERITVAVEDAARGGPPIELPSGGGEELDRLGRAVQTMQRTLQDKLSALGAERGLLASVVSGIREGLLLVDAEGRVRLANQAILAIAGLDESAQGRPLQELIRHPTVLRDVERALDRAEEARDSIVRQESTGRVFQLQVTPLRAKGEPRVQAALVLLFDVTRMEILENVRREFVGNVSHELRTPLTALRASLENLIEGGLDDHQSALRFLGIMEKQAQRMGALIEDLTDLSRIETGVIQLDLRSVDAAGVVAEIVEQTKAFARARGVEVLPELPSPFPVYADRRRLEQMLWNLIDNAIKFNRPSGQVRIVGQAEPERRKLVIEDTGLGIPAESREKIFHRFHRVEPHRSREVGGTGLGLAIVKHLMRLHGGRVVVESELGVGSRFTLEFPEPRAAKSAAEGSPP